MKLEEWKASKNKFTEKLSEVNRYLAMAGIGIIWVFKTEVENKYSIPHELLMPLLLFVFSLGLDFFQYIYSALVWTLFFRCHENQKKSHPNRKEYIDDDIKAPKILPNLSYIFFFFPKVIVNVIGYIYLFGYLIQALMK